MNTITDEPVTEATKNRNTFLDKSNNSTKEPKRHHIKILPEYFLELRLGLKNFEIRLNDRDYEKGDILILNEYDPLEQSLTGQFEVREIGYILHDFTMGLQTGYVAMSLKK